MPGTMNNGIVVDFWIACNNNVGTITEYTKYYGYRVFVNKPNQVLRGGIELWYHPNDAYGVDASLLMGFLTGEEVEKIITTPEPVKISLTRIMYENFTAPTNKHDQEVFMNGYREGLYSIFQEEEDETLDNLQSHFQRF